MADRTLVDRRPQLEATPEYEPEGSAGQTRCGDANVRIRRHLDHRSEEDLRRPRYLRQIVILATRFGAIHHYLSIVLVPGQFFRPALLKPRGHMGYTNSSCMGTLRARPSQSSQKPARKEK